MIDVCVYEIICKVKSHILYNIKVRWSLSKIQLRAMFLTICQRKVFTYNYRTSGKFQHTNKH